MRDEYTLKFHPEFFNDLKKLDRREKETVYKQMKKIKRNPTRYKRLHGIENCYRVRTGILRIVYYLKGRTIYFLVVEKRKTVYGVYFKRLFKIKRRLK
jgi:mRNA-degrading endonuclease RelE of RelBE toxin-antitoxin system